MKKITKLAEKTVRIPDTREAQWEKIFTIYLQQVEPLNNESSRALRFGMLVQELLGLQPGFIESYVSGIEKYIKVKKKDYILKGKTDNLFGNVIIEFEANIQKKRSEAEEQLRRYTAILWSQEYLSTRTPYFCLATDGVRFITYSPTTDKLQNQEIAPSEVSLNILEEVDWTKLKPDEIFYWLDRYFLRKEILHPTSETIVHDFGIKSPAFKTTANSLLILWQEIKTQSNFKVIFDSWEKYLLIVYGSKVAGDELFVRHTYLATLAKIMSWMRITESSSLPEEEQIIGMLEGRLFKELGIENFIEEDFFSWLARSSAMKVGIIVVHRLFSLLQNYNLRELSEDVLKSLYQELVDPETRHNLGEFYTPDWLAHCIVLKMLDINSSGTMLDVTCGSGTFLYLAIREKRERLGDSIETLNHIINSVYGADIHPLAVITAKTNYILALGDLLRNRKGKISIPVYLADTLKLPEFVKQSGTMIIDDKFVQKLPGYQVELDGNKLNLPQILLEDVVLYDNAIELVKEFAWQNKGKPIYTESFKNFLAAQHFSQANNDMLVQALYSIAEVLKNFIEANRDTIWAFVLKNIYKPLFFKRKFDFIIGNPPWIAFRFMEPSYQAFLKRQITEEYKLLRGRGELITQIEMATLFLIRAADLYLKTGGTIAFVMPKSVFSADQHDGLRQRTFKFSEDTVQNLFWREIWDCENVHPLFNVPSCVLIAEKGETAPIKYPVAGQVLKGKLERKNASLEEANSSLNVENVQFSLHLRGKRSFWAVGEGIKKQIASYYKKMFFLGATLFPRSFWFVQLKSSPLGFNPDLPPLETSDRAKKEAKDAYKSVFFKDTMESRFIYATILSTDLLPFGHLGYRMIVLPIEPEDNHYKLIDVEEANKRGYLHLSRWLEKAEQEWKKNRGSKIDTMNIYERIDRFHGMTRQNPQSIQKVIYNTSGTYLTAAIIKNELISFEINSQHFEARGFLADYKTYYYESASNQEALYLASFLNAPLLDKLIKPMQSRGLWGPRDICKKVLEMPIPQFDIKNSVHIRLAEMGLKCSAKVKQWLASGGVREIKSIGRLRGMVREMLKEEIQEIDDMVKGILG